MQSVRAFSSVEYDTKHRHRSFLFSPLPKKDISGQAVTAYTFNLTDPNFNGFKSNEHNEKSKSIILYNDLYDATEVKNIIDENDFNRKIRMLNSTIPECYFIEKGLSCIYLQIIENLSNFHRDINSGHVYIGRTEPLNNRKASNIFLLNLVKNWNEMRIEDKDFFNKFVSVYDSNPVNTSLIVTGSYDNALYTNNALKSEKRIDIGSIDTSQKENELDKYIVRIEIQNVFDALPEVPEDCIDEKDKEGIKKSYKYFYDQNRQYVLPPPGYEFIPGWNKVAFVEKIMSGKWSKSLPSNYKKILSSSNNDEIIAKIATIKGILNNDNDGKGNYYMDGPSKIYLNDTKYRKTIQKKFSINEETCYGTHFTDKKECMNFIQKCINHNGLEGNLGKCVDYITNKSNFPKDIEKMVNKIAPDKALLFLRALGFKITQTGKEKRIITWNQWMNGVVKNSGLTEKQQLDINNNSNLKVVVSYFTEFIHANPVILNKNWNPEKQKVINEYPAPNKFVTNIGLSPGFLPVGSDSSYVSKLQEMLLSFMNISSRSTKFTKDNLNNFNFSLLVPYLVGGNDKINFTDLTGGRNNEEPIIDKKSLLNQVDSILSIQEKLNINIFTQDDYEELKQNIDKLEQLVLKTKSKMEKLIMIQEIVNGGVPEVERLFQLENDVINKVLFYGNSARTINDNLNRYLVSVLVELIKESGGVVPGVATGKFEPIINLN